MSMRDYAYNDYGLVLDEPTLKHLYCKMFDEQDVDMYDMGYELYDKGIVEYTGEFTGEATRIDDKGCDDWRDSILYSADTIYYIPLNKCPSLFNAAYAGINEIISELQSNVGEYMPDGYNYRANIRHIVGTTFG